MNRSIELTENDREQLREVVRVAVPSQKELAVKARVTQPWLSQVLKGRRRSINADMLERVRLVLVDSLEDPSLGIPSEQLRDLRAFLRRVGDLVAGRAVQANNYPGDLVHVGAEYYITRSTPDKRGPDDQINEALDHMPFTMLVRGPVQCGKSSLLIRLESRAKRLGVETATFDPWLPPLDYPPHKPKGQADINARAARALSQMLQAQWQLEPPRDRGSDPIAALLSWLPRVLNAKPKPRLLIFDDLASLGARAADEWTSRFFRAMDNKHASGLQLSIGIGMTQHYGPHYQQRAVETSSAVVWRPSIELEWLDPQQVFQLETRISGRPPNDSDLFQLFGGQPYLSHAAVVYGEFREAVRRWLDDPSDANARYVRSAEPYRRHFRRNLRATVAGGPRAVLDKRDETRKVIEAFLEVCSGASRQLDADHRKFLETAWLLKKPEKPDDIPSPALELYRLFAEDFRETLAR
jgi:transcriptional regulator with XRE-family HTH domain